MGFLVVVIDTAAKMFYVTKQYHVIKASSDFMEGNSSLYIPTRLESHIHCVHGYIIILVCHVIL